jgi:hypothetical protein
MSQNSLYSLVYNPKKRLFVDIDTIPQTYVRAINPFDCEAERKDKKKFPFKLANDVTMFIKYKGQNYTLFFDKGFKWDGSSIPKILWAFIGSNADPSFLLASMPHDLVCRKHWLILNDRYLSSLIFYEILKSCGVNKFKAWIMYKAVDMYQRTQGWDNG